ncbi:MerC domain-containing protein [Winogradskyella sp. F6397]|uniref:MerC domain-containing protein n=1 Tax=Winogradskyella marina TaxID=2785530 RepID=A0ABS0EL01_9FLAO|nr:MULTISPECIES: MerC domain-containing protein [Winogradskyella]MBF8151144.1 MerC domain-containing protein [Winogradskyella marina]
MIQTKQINWADKLGAFSALLCIVHCLAVPALLTMGMGFISNPIIAYLFIFIAFFSIYKATNGRFLKPVSIFLWLAFTGFVISMLLEDQAEVFEYTMFLSSGLIILGHLYNMKYCSK